jgi:prolyl oligopeptidase
VICSVPLLDMLRYHLLLAGASWVGEYGDPDDQDMADYLASYSPFHTVKPGVDYPTVFFVTSTRDDRVHPGHARKMVARMIDQGHDVHYYENTEGGHSAGANLKQQARLSALQYVYLDAVLAP